MLKEFIQFFEGDNDWVTEGKRYSHCLISDHQCPVKVWNECRSTYWTDCTFDLEDVETLERVYHNPPPLGAEDEEHDVSTNHVHHAVRETHDAQDRENQGEAQGHQGIDRSNQQTIEDQSDEKLTGKIEDLAIHN